ncbi:RsmD family RNA methyltransferase [Brevibacterium marinum]|uniref:16S rRNA (Guanine966-N2)-methyltransferase n=1 Tax=Brevibacterium marinum TaxID=418643 RepID=A0A846RSX0_9MICO|nr:RsmD family RNA methyltransferase [Brevibacterium marinum]NJC56859.1 16S rRNA (guanine966-N2)-methyltransferase [Brevibacterium marinum]
MRIIAGAFKGSRLVAPSGSNTRPTSDRVKESLFSMLDGYGVLKAANVLDLFAGSGGLGLEAMSRGAAEVDFVDSSGSSARAVEANAKKLGIGHSTRIHSADVVSFLASQHGSKQQAPEQHGQAPEQHDQTPEQHDPVQLTFEQHGSESFGGLDVQQEGGVLEARSDDEGRIFDLVFMDPPYPLGEDAVTQILSRLSGLLDMESIVVVERASRAPEPMMPSTLEVFRTKTFGETTLHFVQLTATTEDVTQAV